VTRQPSMVSFMRLRQRRKVDLPHPEGPIIDSTSFLPMSRLTPLMACLAPYQTSTLRQVMRGSATVTSPTVAADGRFCAKSAELMAPVVLSITSTMVFIKSL